jgi:hypothetical protein
MKVVPVQRSHPGLILAVLLLAHLGACSLVSVKTPGQPLSARDMNTRILTREYTAQFRDAVTTTADGIIAGNGEADVATHALRWKAAAVAASQRASMQIVPLMGLLDSWTLALQMQAFVAEGGAGDALFGTHQSAVQSVATKLALEADALAARLLPRAELEQTRGFVTAYVRANPLSDLDMVRPSVVIAWNQGRPSGQKLVDSVGSVPEATADLAQRLQIYSETTPSQMMWQTQLALREAGYSGEDLRTALKRLDGRLDALSAAVDKAPGHVNQALDDVRGSMLEVVDRMNAASLSLIETLRVERVALAENVRTEREAVMLAVDAQRKAFALDAAGIAAQVVRDSGVHLRVMAREAMVWLVLMSIVVLGLPFAAGYMAGRARNERGRSRPVPQA